MLPKPQRLMAVPRAPHARLEIAKAVRALAVIGEAEEVRRRRDEAAAIRRDCEQIRRSLRDACREWAVLATSLMKRSLPQPPHPLTKAYDPDEPRVPKHHAGGGQWTKEEAGAGSNMLTDLSGHRAKIDAEPHSGRGNDPRVISDASPDISWKAGAQYAQVVVANNAETGNPAIDRTTQILLQTLMRVQAAAGSGSGAWYGTRIHVLFANDVMAQNLPGIGKAGVEESFSLGDIAKYGEDGTVRVDVYMRDETGKIIAIWDVKTGGAILTGARVRQLRAHTGAGSDVPVIELHIIRGATRKARMVTRIAYIIAILRDD